MLSVFFILTVFTFGLAIGSFLNCLIYRLEKGKSFLKGRSYCPDCHHQLGFWELIPILSFLFLKGRCRHCHQVISFQYPLVELFTGILFVLLFNFQNLSLSIYYLLISCFLIIVFVYDFKFYLIPDKVIYPAIVIALFYNLLLFDFFSRFDFFISALGAAAFFLAIVLASRGRWMGIGDIKLAFLMGLILGFPNILAALFLAFLTGAIIGVGLIALNLKTLKSEVPFGPFLVASTFIALFWGEKLINWYLNFFNYY